MRCLLKKKTGEGVVTQEERTDNKNYIEAEIIVEILVEKFVEGRKKKEYYRMKLVRKN